MNFKKILINALNTSKGMFLDPQKTGLEFKNIMPEWKDTLLKTYLPIILIVTLSSLILSLVTNTYGYSFGGISILLQNSIYQIIFGVLSTIAFSAVFSFTAKYFEGTPNFNSAIALLTLSSLPYLFSSIFMSASFFIGALLALVGLIYTIYVLYKLIPAFMSVSDDKRVPYLIVSIIACIIASIPLSFVFVGGTGLTSSNYMASVYTGNDQLVDEEALTEKEFTNDSAEEDFLNVFQNLGMELAENDQERADIKRGVELMKAGEKSAKAEDFLQKCLSKKVDIQTFNKKIDKILDQRGYLLLINGQTTCRSGKSEEQVRSIIRKQEYDLLSTVLSKKELSIYQKCEAQVDDKIKIDVCKMYGF